MLLPAAAQALPDPTIAVDPSQDELWVSGFDAYSNSLWVVIDGHGFGTGTDGAGNVYLDLYHLVDILAGSEITVTGPVGGSPVTVSYTATSLDIWPRWSGAPNDLMGTADPGSEVCIDQEGRPRVCVTAGPDGKWSSPTPAERGTATQRDDAGNATSIDFRENFAFFFVDRFGGGGWGHWFWRNTPIRVLVNNAEVATFASDRTGYWAGSFPVQAGDVVTVTDGIATKVTTVTNIEVTGIDAGLDRVWGLGNPMSEFQVGVPGLPSENHLVGSTGAWLVDFAGRYDIACGTMGYVRQVDPDEDQTSLNWFYGYSGPPWVEADAAVLRVAAGQAAVMTGTVIDEPCANVWMREMSGPGGTVTNNGDGTWTWEWLNPVVGSWMVIVEVNDGAAPAFASFELYVEPFLWPFSGFFPPVDNPPVVNVAKAGSAIPVKFSLGGDRGLDIMAATESGGSYPVSRRVACDTGAPLDQIEETVTAGSSSLSYDPVEDQYVYVWKTPKQWVGTCRELIVGLDDGSEHTALFRFK